jgi:hypothetical protein
MFTLPGFIDLNTYFAAWTRHFQTIVKERPIKRIFKVNHTLYSKPSYYAINSFREFIAYHENV